MLRSAIIVSTLVLSVACTDTTQAHHENDESKAFVYQYEPVVSTLTGTLTTQVYWGPPNYGEDTTMDERETEYILVLDKAISISKPDSDLSDGYNAAIANVKQLQIVHSQKLDAYVHKKVKAVGSLFGAQTGHHHTDVLLDLKSIR